MRAVDKVVAPVAGVIRTWFDFMAIFFPARVNSFWGFSQAIVSLVVLFFIHTTFLSYTIGPNSILIAIARKIWLFSNISEGMSMMTTGDAKEMKILMESLTKSKSVFDELSKSPANSMGSYLASSLGYLMGSNVA
jgi:hypothetical protein